MDYTRTCFCGDDEIEITANSSVLIRLATENELSSYKKKHWIFPNLDFQKNLWEEMCSVINSISDFWTSDPNTYIWYKFVPKECDVKEDTTEYDDFGFEKTKSNEYTASLSYCSVKLSNNTIEIDSEYTYRIEYKEGNEEKYTEKSTHNTTTIPYPNGFHDMLMALYSYIKKKKEPQKRLFTDKLKQPKLTKSSLKIDAFFRTNEKDIKLFKKYYLSLKKICDSKEYRDYCANKHYFLIVNGKIYFDYDCGFDIIAKEEEIKFLINDIKKQINEEKILVFSKIEEARREEEKKQQEEYEKCRILQDTIHKKKNNSKDPGEVEVDYAIKWFLAEYEFTIVPIKKDCESKYRFDCILLSKPDFIDEPQEYDHILVSDAGVIIIETKHWTGRVEIRRDGKWIRESTNDDGKYSVFGEKNPIAQLKRHEILMKKILPGVPVYSMLCFSNKHVILDGIENCTEYSIIYVDQLGETISRILSNSKSRISVDQVVQEIENHKINIETSEHEFSIHED